MSSTSAQLARRRRVRTRNKLRKVSKLRPRLSVFRSSRNIYAQIIDDTAGRTLAQASTKDKDFKGTFCLVPMAGTGMIKRCFAE